MQNHQYSLAHRGPDLLAIADMKPNVLIVEPIGRTGLQRLESSCRCIADWRGTAEDWFERAQNELPGADAVIVRLFPLGAAEFAAARRLKVVAKAGVGLDNIDCDAATKRGIPVVYAAGANSNAVAEHTIMMMLSMARKAQAAHRTVKSAQPYLREDFVGTELASKTLGIIGLGRVGSRVSVIAARGLGMKVLAYDPYVSREGHAVEVRFCDALPELLEEADYVTLHVPLTSETRGMIGAESLGLLKPDGYLINTARGAVVDGLALAHALGRGELAGAALDVFEEEPLPSDHPIREAPNTLFTPHIAGSTHEAMEAVSLAIAEDILAVLEGRPPKSAANPESLKH